MIYKVVVEKNWIPGQVRNDHFVESFLGQDTKCLTLDVQFFCSTAKCQLIILQ